MVQTFGLHGSHPSLSDGSGRPKRRTNLPYSETPHAAIEVRAIAAVAIVYQESWWRSIPDATFHDLLGGPVRRRMPRHCNVEDLPVCAVERRDHPVGDRPTRQLSLQPVAIGAVVEVTKRLKPLMERVT
jgi:hypothetical protein